MATVKLGYASPLNISFKGEHDTGIEREEWDEMSEETRRDVETDAVWELVEMWEIED